MPANFTKAHLTAAPAAKGRYDIRDGRTPGLMLTVTAAGHKAFYYRKKIDGSAKRFKIGNYPEVTIDQARKQAGKLAAQVAAGTDPSEAKRQRREAMTVAEAWTAYTTEKVRKPSTIKVDASLWKKLAMIESKALQSITQSDLRAMHKSIGEKSEASANRTMRLLRRVYLHAKKFHSYKGDIPTDGVVFFNEDSRERFMSGDEIKRYLKAAREEADPWAAFFEIALFTGARRSNLEAMQWAAIDFDAKTWTIDKAEAKAGKSITLPLTPQAMATLERMQKQTGKSVWVFPGRRNNGGHIVNPTKPLSRICNRAGINDLRLHDVRRSAGSFLAAAGVPLLTIAQLLGHSDLRATKIYARLAVDDLRKDLEAATARMDTL